MNGKTYIPELYIHEVIRDHYDNPAQGHLGVTKTMELLERNYSAPKLRKYVEKYIKEYIICQRNKAIRYKKYGEIQFSKVPTTPWDDVTIDFITKLPKSGDPVSKEKYDAIMVIVDKLTKYSILIPFKETYRADQLGFILLDRLIRDHGIPRTITSDRDKLFTSNYWKTLIGCIGTKLKMSTAYHPETDGQTERTNQTLEAYLRYYVHLKQNNWVQLLPMAQLALNNKVLDTTKYIPFFANFGRNPNLFLNRREGPNAQQALKDISDIKLIHQRLSANIKVSRPGIAQNANKKRKISPQLKEGDKVYLLIKNLKTKRPSRKLDHVKVGPFLIRRIKGPNNYKLQLPPDARIYPVFHISLLEPADSTTPLQEIFYYEDDGEYEVERILDQRGQKYLIKWKDCDDSENTWEPYRNLAGCQDLLRKYRRGQEKL